MTQPFLSRLGYGFIFSIPTAVIILGSESMSKTMNNEVQLAIIALAFIVAVPWSIAAGVLYLMTFSMHGSTALVVAYGALAIFLVGAHFNAVFLFGPKPPKVSNSVNETHENEKKQSTDA